MEYKVKFKRLEKGDNPEDNYVSIGDGLQYQGITTPNAPANILFSVGIILSKLSTGRAIESVVPKGKTLEIIFKDE